MIAALILYCIIGLIALGVFWGNCSNENMIPDNIKNWVLIALLSLFTLTLWPIVFFVGFGYNMATSERSGGARNNKND